MKAIVQDEYGSSDVLQLEGIDKPETAVAGDSGDIGNVFLDKVFDDNLATGHFHFKRLLPTVGSPSRAPRDALPTIR